MKSNENAVVYTAESTAAELNKVKGFDPMKYVRHTESGGVLDLPYQKLWFRLRHPNGKIRFFIRSISDKVSAIEARVYFDRRDSEPASNYIVSGVDITNNTAVAKAQRSAMENALTDAGFGLQFIAANPPVQSVVKETEKKVIKMQKTVEAPKTAKEQPVEEPKPVEETPVQTEVKEEKPDEAPVSKTETKPIQAETPPVVAETKADTPAPPKADPLLSIVNSLENSAIKVNTQTGEVVEEPAKVEDVPEEKPTEVTTQVEQSAEPPITEVKTVSYDKNTPVEDICASMTLEDAMNYVIEGGPYNGWKMSTIAERRPIKVLEMMIEKYPVQDNILRAATKIILDSKK